MTDERVTATSPDHQRARDIIVKIVKQFREQSSSAPNPLRHLEACAEVILSQLSKERLWQYAPLKSTIGDINPRSFGKTRNGKEDPQEIEFATLADEMCLDPTTERYSRMLKYKKRIGNTIL
ncbi:MAG: hypothetical protein ACK4FL_03810 [Microgenomates group bacterium]